jgi:hypothetical protein
LCVGAGQLRAQGHAEPHGLARPEPVADDAANPRDADNQLCHASSSLEFPKFFAPRYIIMGLPVAAMEKGGAM